MMGGSRDKADIQSIGTEGYLAGANPNVTNSLALKLPNITHGSAFGSANSKDIRLANVTAGSHMQNMG
jgi:hypothetical protein